MDIAGEPLGIPPLQAVFLVPRASLSPQLTPQAHDPVDVYAFEPVGRARVQR